MKGYNPCFATLEQAHPLRSYERWHGKLTYNPERWRGVPLGRPSFNRAR